MADIKKLHEDLRVLEHRHAYVAMFAKHLRYPIAVTIQPNFGFEQSPTSIRQTSPGWSDRQSYKLRELLRELFYQLDRGYSGCKKPHYLGADWRFDGVVFPEGLNTNPHAHVFLTCKNAMHQLWRYWFLLWALDTNPAQSDPEGLETDEANEASAWDILNKSPRPWMAWNDPCRKSRFLQTLSFDGKLFAPAGTAKVQLIRSYYDAEQVLTYDTKKWGASTTDTRSVRADDLTYNFWELREHFSMKGVEDPARCCRYDPNKPGCYLPANGNRIWRTQKGKVIT